ncbi:MAG TPA: 2-C-methyl-D-erythritol 4-phosphate cytidylyltransferase [Fibrobacteria bacterium]|nr:2-C-methyl-D-erythritol 4-phosphate cytidylyltransferase [Fibrobacteria bacterium]
MEILSDTGVVLPCAGAGLRVGAARPKQFLDLGGRPVYHRSLTAFLAHPRIAAVVLVVAPEELHQVRTDLTRFYGSMISSGRLALAEGGDERWISVKNGVQVLPVSVRLFAIHDVARPFLTAQDIDSVLCAAQLDGASTLAVSCPDTVKRAVAEADPLSGPPPLDGRVGPLVESTLDRRRIWLTQTPQAFRREILEDCYSRAEDLHGAVPTDEAGLAESFGHPVRLVRGADRLRKITTAEDLEWARWMLGKNLGGGLPA